jgi:hypothetical protein
MPKRINHEGKKYGKLTVLSFSHSGKHRQSFWFCLCECGNKCIINLSRSLDRKTKSCGCLRKDKEIRKKINEKRAENITEESLKLVFYKMLYGPYKLRHTKKFSNEEFLTLKEFIKIIKNPCEYCGSQNTMKFHSCYKQDGTLKKHVKKQLTYIKLKNAYVEHNGLDRVNSLKGYSLDNVVSCCERCNEMKMQYSVEEFLKHIKNIFVFNKLGEDK